MIVKFITVKGQGNIASNPFYVGFVQHERTMSKRETYDYCAERTGADLAPDPTKDDEYVALVYAHGVETRAVIERLKG